MDAGKQRVALRAAARPGHWPAMILAAKFTKKAPDSMNFVNFAGKTLCLQASQS